MTNCKNCGAPLPTSAVCEYCGTDYNSNDKNIKIAPKINANFEKDGMFGQLIIGNSTYRVYLSKIEEHQVWSKNTGRDQNGNLCGNIVKTVREFTLIEG